MNKTLFNYLLKYLPANECLDVANSESPAILSLLTDRQDARLVTDGFLEMLSRDKSPAERKEILCDEPALNNALLDYRMKRIGRIDPACTRC